MKTSLAQIDTADDAAQKEWTRGSSELKGPLLALLLERPGHGYDLAGRLYKRLGSSWQIEPKELYPMLARLERRGLLSSYETDSSRSSKRVKIYEPTELTRDAVAKWIGSPLPIEPVRGAVLARIAFSTPEDAPLLLWALDEYQRLCFRILKEGKGMYPVDQWRSMQMEVARLHANMRLEADLEWINLTRGYIANFPGVRRASADA